MKFFEDLRLGERLDLGRQTLDADEMIAFARRYDPAGWEAVGDHPAASGWLVVGLWMRGWVAFVQRIDDAARSAGEPVAALGPAPGLERLEWPRPAFAGDTLAFASEVVGLRVSRSRPQWGLMTLHNTGHLVGGAAEIASVRNGGAPPGDCVLRFTSSAFVERRNPSAET